MKLIHRFSFSHVFHNVCNLCGLVSSETFETHQVWHCTLCSRDNATLKNFFNRYRYRWGGVVLSYFTMYAICVGCLSHISSETFVTHQVWHCTLCSRDNATLKTKMYRYRYRWGGGSFVIFHNVCNLCRLLQWSFFRNG